MTDQPRKPRPPRDPGVPEIRGPFRRHDPTEVPATSPMSEWTGPDYTFYGACFLILVAFCILCLVIT